MLWQFRPLEQALATGLVGLPPVELVERAVAYADMKGHEDYISVVALRRE
jgi:hypothetical protein